MFSVSHLLFRVARLIRRSDVGKTPWNNNTTRVKNILKLYWYSYRGRKYSDRPRGFIFFRGFFLVRFPERIFTPQNPWKRFWSCHLQPHRKSVKGEETDGGTFISSSKTRGKVISEVLSPPSFISSPRSCFSSSPIVHSIAMISRLFFITSTSSFDSSTRDFKVYFITKTSNFISSPTLSSSFHHQDFSVHFFTKTHQV